MELRRDRVPVRVLNAVMILMTPPYRKKEETLTGTGNAARVTFERRREAIGVFGKRPNG